MNANTPQDPQDPALQDNSDPSYAYRPNMMGAPWTFALRRDGIEWEYGRHSGMVRYDQVKRVRMSFRPATLQSHRFLTEIWSEGSPKLQIASVTFRGMMDQARQDAEYRAFVTELHRRLAAARSSASFQAGMNPVLYWLGAVVFAGIGLALGAFLLRTVLGGDLKGVLVIATVIALMLWQVCPIMICNRPVTYDPAAPPSRLLPRS